MFNCKSTKKSPDLENASVAASGEVMREMNLSSIAGDQQSPWMAHVGILEIPRSQTAYTWPVGLFAVEYDWGGGKSVFKDFDHYLV